MIQQLLSIPRRAIYALVNVQDKKLYLGLSKNARSKIPQIIANPETISLGLKRDLEAGKVELVILQGINTTDPENDMLALQILFQKYKQLYKDWQLYAPCKKTLQLGFGIRIENTLKRIEVYSFNKRYEGVRVLGVFDNMDTAKEFLALCKANGMIYAYNEQTVLSLEEERQLRMARVRTPMYG